MIYDIKNGFVLSLTWLTFSVEIVVAVRPGQRRREGGEKVVNSPRNNLK
jgi:hypothetical protein